MVKFSVESWIWYTFAVGMIVARLVSRTLLFRGPKGLQYDDWIMGLFVTSCYTVLIVMLNQEASTKSNLISPGFDISTLTAQDIADREYGSKIVVIIEQMYICIIWACKACLLILYHRLTHMVAVKENIAVKMLAVYIALGFVVMEILYFGAWCRPFQQYWAVPSKSLECTTLTSHRITNAVFNISSECMILCIGCPMFLRSQLPWKRKFILCCVFSLGIFAIIAAGLNKYYSFTRPYEPTWINWYVRETSTAILVANLPFTWTLLRKIFNLGAFDEEHPPPPTYHSSRTAGGRRTARAHTHPHSHQGASGGSGEKHSGTHTNGSGEKRGRSLSLIGSMCAAKEEEHHEPVSDNSQHSENRLLEAASIQPRDFGSAPVSRPNTSPDFITNAYDMSSNLERGISPSSAHSLPPARPVSLSPSASHRGRLSPTPSQSGRLSPTPSQSRQLSPAPSRRGRRSPTPSNHHNPSSSCRPSIDSTIRPFPAPTSLLTSPRRAHLAPDLARSRSSSVASASTANTFATSLRTATIIRTGTAVGPVTGTGGGRSARDRRARARMST